MRARTLSVALIVVATLVALVAVPAVAAGVVPRAGTPTKPISRDLSSYVLFAFDTLEFKGGNAAGRGVISGGNVGANTSANPCANGRLIMDDGTQLNAGQLRASHECDVWDIYANTTVGAFDVVPRNSGPTPFTAPILTAPAGPAVACDPSNPFTVEKNNKGASMAPGTYGSVNFKDGSEVQLTAGVYVMCDLSFGQSVTVHTVPGTELRIDKSFLMSDGTTFGGPTACGVPIYIGSNGVKKGDASATFGQNAEIYGHFFVPNGRIRLGHGNDLFGAFWALDLNSDFNTNVTQCPPQTGEFPISKLITGSGAGLQGGIEIQITCSAPNSSIPPFTIPPNATGSWSTVVTGITVPATCTVTEVNTGDNDAVDVSVTVLGGGAVGGPAVAGAPRAAAVGATQNVPVCPPTPALHSVRRSNLTEQGAAVINQVETTTTSPSSTTTTTTTPDSTTTTTGDTTTTTTGDTTTTSAGDTTTTTSTTTTTTTSTSTSIATTTTAGSTTTGSTVTTTAPSTTLAPTTVTPTTVTPTTVTPTTGAPTTGGTIPPDCTVPPTVSPTEVLPATGTDSVSPMLLLALLLGAIGAVLLIVTTVRRPTDA